MSKKKKAKITKHGARRLRRRIHTYKTVKQHLHSVCKYGLTEKELVDYPYLAGYVTSKQVSHTGKYLIFAQALYAFDANTGMLITVYKLPQELIALADKLCAAKRRAIDEAEQKKPSKSTLRHQKMMAKHARRMANQQYLEELYQRLDPL